MDIVIRPPSPSERPAWSDLWGSYLTFYETDLPDGQPAALWDRILDADSTIQCHVAEQHGRLVGLVHFLAHDDTWSSRPICYLQDLYVDRSHRGKGVGEKLIASVVKEAERHGWSAVYWLTADDNQRARALYDRLSGGPSGFIHYELDVTPEQL